MNGIRNHGTLNLMPDHMNDFLTETWKNLKMKYTSITYAYLKKTHLLPLSPTEKYKYHQDCLVDTLTSKVRKADGIKLIANARIDPKDTE